jgi:hypothetical protein
MKNVSPFFTACECTKKKASSLFQEFTYQKLYKNTRKNFHSHTQQQPSHLVPSKLG